MSGDDDFLFHDLALASWHGIPSTGDVPAIDHMCASQQSQVPDFHRSPFLGQLCDSVEQSDLLLCNCRVCAALYPAATVTRSCGNV